MVTRIYIALYAVHAFDSHHILGGGPRGMVVLFFGRENEHPERPSDQLRVPEKAQWQSWKKAQAPRLRAAALAGS